MNIGVLSQGKELEEESSVTLTKPLTKQTNFDPGKLMASFKWGGEKEKLKIWLNKHAIKNKSNVGRKIHFKFFEGKSKQISILC